MLAKQEKKLKRQKRVRAKIFGTKDKPRFSVFRSAKHVYAQLVDDDKGKTIISASDREIKKTKSKDPKLTGKKAIAYELGKLIAEKAKNLPAGRQVEKVVFDRRGYKYHGRIKALAEGAREGGLKF
ncbi:MAG: 50S ribosomal protein L18 [bacterium]|nr:50S ribosomal protein L18 [bacterium]